MRLASPTNRLLAVFLALVLSLAGAGCAIKLVSDYDSAAFEEILATGKKVDKFYGTLLETKPDARQYSAFSDQYVAIETDIQGIITRNQARALNAESTEIARSILGLMSKYKDRHKERNDYSDGNAKLDRGRFVRLFAGAASAEEAKKLTVDDKDAKADTKTPTK